MKNENRITIYADQSNSNDKFNIYILKDGFEKFYIVSHRANPNMYKALQGITYRELILITSKKPPRNKAQAKLHNSLIYLKRVISEFITYDLSEEIAV